MDIWNISNLFAILNNAAVEILEHIYISLRISVEYKPRKDTAGSKICMFYFTEDPPKRMDKYST